VGATVETVIRRKKEATVVPRKKNQSEANYALEAGRSLIKRMTEAHRVGGTEAAWKVIFGAICEEGQFVQEASPSALVIYQAYVVVADSFLERNPDPKKVLALLTRIVKDLELYEVYNKKMKHDNFSEQEWIVIMVCLNTLKTTIDEISRKNKK
jgi:hypothetical protein